MPVQLDIKSYTGGMVQTNAYYIKNEGQSLLIDAPLGVCAWLESQGEMPTDLLLTHQHYDHVEDVAKLIHNGVRVHAHSSYSQELTLETLKKSMGLPLSVEPYEVNDLLDDKTEILAAGLRFRIEHIPGHSPDSIVFIIDGYAFVGDTVFAGSIGRADLPGGDMSLLIQGIKSKLLHLKPATRIFPGHGPETSIASESAKNPYLQ
ncbi:MAG: MBL fold metallo-hydrolase [Akkermansiaceae bacterium]